MKKKVLLFMTAAAVSSVMVSCGKDEVDVTMQPNTVTVSGRVTDYNTGTAVANAEIKNGDQTVATTDANGVFTLTKKETDQPLYTVKASGYADALLNGNTLQMRSLSAKLSGTATYTSADGSLATVPSGTSLSVKLSTSGLAVLVYTATVGANGKYEFTLPENTNGQFVSPVTIGSQKYSVSTGFNVTTAATPSSQNVQLSYVAPPTEALALLSYPGTVTTTGTITISFNIAVESSTLSIYVSSVGTVNGVLSADSKSVTFTLPTGENWGSVGNTLTVDGRVSASGNSYYIYQLNNYQDIRVRIIQ